MRTRTVAVFKNGSNRAIRLPKDFDFDGVNEQEISRDGDCIILRPVKPNWISLQNEKKPTVISCLNAMILLTKDELFCEKKPICLIQTFVLLSCVSNLFLCSKNFKNV